MPAPTNLGFETGGGALGSAAGWFIGSGSTTALAAPPWIAAGWSRYSAGAGTPATDATVPFLGPNDFKGVNGFWTESNTNVDSDFTTDPLGTTTADRLRDNLVNVAHFIQETAGPRPFKAGVRYTFGIFFKNSLSGVPFIGPRIDFGGGVVMGVLGSAGNPPYILSGSAAANPVSSLSAETFELGNGWVCIAMSFVLASDVSARPGFGFQAGGSEVYAGTLAGHYVWGAFIYADVLTESEDFESGWGSYALPYLFTLVLGTSSLGATFGNGTITPGSFDGFEGGWNNSPYLLTIAGSFDTAVWDAGGTDGAFETFDAGAGWDATYAGDPFPDPSYTACFFDAAGANENFDSFEFDAGWDATYVFALSAPTAANFDGPVSENVEDFEEVQADVQVSPTATTPLTLTKTAHGITLNTVLRLINIGGSFPGGTVRTLDYFAVTINPGSFQLALTASGAAINSTDLGTGDLYVRGSGERYWWGPDINPTI